MLACKDAVELSRRLVSSDLLLTQEDFEEKFVNMQSTLGPLIGDEAMDGIGASVSYVYVSRFEKKLNFVHFIDFELVPSC